MKYSEHYKLRLPQRGGEDGADDAADINDLTYNFEVLDGLLAAFTQTCDGLEQDKAEAEALARHMENHTDAHGMAALTTEQLAQLLG